MVEKSRYILFFFCLVFVSCNAQKETSKELKVKEIVTDKNVTLDQVSKLLEAQVELHSIAIINWESFSYQPEVSFRIAHANNQIWLKYYVTEETILAKVDTINGSVSGDSCVEFFFDPQADGNYYNFEFSCIGMPHLAYGSGRGARQFMEKEIIKEQITVASTLGDEPFEERIGGHTWEMTIVIPSSVLFKDKGIRLKGLKTKANFYKCGDKTSQPHYLSWNAVGTETPDFHRPEYFGTLIFE